MAIHSDSNALLRAIPLILEGVSVDVVDDAGGEVDSFGTKPVDAEEVRVGLPVGELVATVGSKDPVQALVRSLLTTIAERERLESDMESMNGSALRLLEQVSMMGETLPRLSAGGDDTEIVALGLRACHRAAGVERVIYVAGDLEKEFCEVVVHDAGAAKRLRSQQTEPEPMQRATLSKTRSISVAQCVKPCDQKA